MKTLFSRHSTLNTGLPTATVLTGSLISRTVKWFKAVSTWRICPRSGFCTSTFCPQAGNERTATAMKEFQSLFTFPPCHPYIGTVQEAQTSALLDRIWFTMGFLLVHGPCSLHSKKDSRRECRDTAWSSSLLRVLLRWCAGECRLTPACHRR